MNSFVVGAGLLLLFAAFIGAAIWRAKREGRRLEHARAVEDAHEVETEMADVVGKPRDPAGTVDRLRKHEF